MKVNRVKLVVYVPTENADDVRLALAEAGAGRIGSFTYGAFSVPGVSRYWPSPVANPFVQEALVITEGVEERIEVTVDSEMLKDVIAAVKEVHPFEEAAYDVYPLLDVE